MKEHRDLAAWEQRRFEAIKLFEKGVKQAEIARRLSVTPQAVSNWVRGYKRAGKDVLASKPHEGRPHKLSETQEEDLLKQLERGPSAHGYSTELWTGERIARLIRDRYQVRMHFKHVPKLLRQLGWSYQRPTRKAAERDDEAVNRWLKTRWPQVKKKARRKKATLVFVDESGFSLAPTCVRTWAPVGETPVLVHRLSYIKLSAISAVTDRGKLLMMVRRGTFGKQQIVAFLRHLLRHLRGRLILVWDNLSAHRSKAVRDFAHLRRRRLSLEFLPAYSPDLNPDEWVWRRLKHVEMGNFAPKDLAELSTKLRDSVQRIRKRPRLLKSFLEASRLSF